MPAVRTHSGPGGPSISLFEAPFFAPRDHVYRHPSVSGFLEEVTVQGVEEGYNIIFQNFTLIRIVPYAGVCCRT